MKKILASIVFSLLFTTISFGQDLQQTVRGIILDTDSKLPLIGVAILIPGTNPLIGTATDENGNFRLENVPTGRINIQLSYLGYESQTIPNLVVDSGKELILKFYMQESVETMDEVVLKAKRKKGKAINDMSLISAQSISLEESKRFSGVFNDPARVVSNYAGVANTQDGSSDIIVRGNSPKYLQWRLEGMEITSPYHFNDQNAAGGGLSVLNNNLLATSDFYTGAFSAEYGDVLSGVLDVKLREGNNEKFESSFGFGLIGTDLTLEGPFKKDYEGSYLFNYRYSTVAVIDDLGLVDIGGVPKFQDLAFKVVLPTKKYGNFSIFGLGGYSELTLEGVKPSVWITPGDNVSKEKTTEDYKKRNFLYNIGLNHKIGLNDHSFINTSIYASGDGIEDDVFEAKVIERENEQGELINDTLDYRQNFKSRLLRSTYRGAIQYNNKIDAKNKIQLGSKYALFRFNNKQSQLASDEGNRENLVDFDENIASVSNFINWKHRINKDLTVVAGLHNMNVLFNNKSTLEPRVAFRWKLNNKHTIHAGYGSHSTMESVHNYFAKVKGEDGSISEPNKDLGLLKAHHFVVGYEKRFTENLVAKVELYYQDLYNLPVENNDTSYYATINEGIEYQYVDLVNEGTGKNYGIEFTLERFFNDHYFFIVNGSLYESKYKSLDGIERNTRYNGNYLFNILVGKEYVNLGKKRNQTLNLNAKLFYGGGEKYIPLLRDENGALNVDPANNSFWDHSKAYEDKIEDIFQLNFSASYKFSRPAATHEIFLDLINITDNRGKIREFYDPSEANGISYTQQFGLFPNLMYRVYF